MAKQAQFLPANTDDDITDVFETYVENEKGERTTQQKRLDDILSDLNNSEDDAEIRIYKQSPLGGKATMSFCDSFPVDKYSMSQLQLFLKQKYGGGDYRVHVRVNGSLKANRLITIESEVKNDQVRTSASEAGDMVSTVAQLIERQNQQMMAILAQRQNDEDSEEKMMRKMMMYKQLFASDNSGANNGISQLRESIEVLGSLGIEIGGPKEEEDSGFTNLLEKMTPVISAAMNQPQTRPQPKPQAKQGDNSMFGNIMLKAGIKSLLTAASKKADPITYAEFVMDQLPEETVKQFITDPKAAEKLLALEPKVAQYKDWFDDLAEHVKGQLGMPCKHSHLYEVVDSDITSENDDGATIDAQPETNV